MVLPKIFQSKKTSNTKYLCLLLTEDRVQACLWQVEGGQSSIIKTSTPHSYADQDQAVIETDKALQELGKASEDVSQVVFGLYPSWVENGDVVPTKKPLLKKLTDDLELEPQGYVITSESLIERLAGQNPRLSALLLEFNQHELYLTLAGQGQLIGTTFVGRSGQVVADMAEALARLNAHHETDAHLPPKMLLISNELSATELQELQQEILDQDWVNSHPFNQPPTVELLDPNLILESVVGQGGTSKEEPVVPIDSSTAASTFGIPIKTNLPANENPAQKEVEDEVDLPHETPTDKKKSRKLPAWMKSFLSWFKHHKTFALVGFASGLLALLIIGWIGLATSTRAEVKLDMETRILSRETEITLDPTRTESDAARRILAAQELTKQVTGSKIGDASGTKLVGDKATGEVTLYNKTTSPKTFEGGTTLSLGNLTFTLDETVEVASASVKVSAGSESKDYGSTTAKVTAEDIGADYNLDKDAELQIASFDTGTYSAAVTSGFSGGSSREIRVISADDRADLLSALEEELIEQANEELSQDIDEGVYLVALDEAEVESQEFSAEIGDEVSTFSLDLTIIATALSYRTQDLEPIAQEVLKSELPENYTLEGSEPQILSTPNGNTASDSAELEVNLSAEARPDLNFDELKTMVAGRRLQEAEQALTSLDDINGVEIKLSPSLAHTFRPRLPKDPAKIELL